MHIYSCPKGTRFIAAALFFFSFLSFSFAQEKALSSSAKRGKELAARPAEKQEHKKKEKKKKKEELTGFQEQARLHRIQGLEAQRIGNLDEAMSFYQKALELDPAYAVVYNDLGVIYETQGLADRAEAYYLAAIKLDPQNSGAYTNLALLYENKRDLEKAVSCWQKRVELGPGGDPWTQKAEKRLRDLTEVVPQLKEDVLQQETEKLAEEVARQKKTKVKQAQDRVAAAKKLGDQGKYKEAIDELYTILTINPGNQDAAVLMDKMQKKIAEEKKQARVKEIDAHYKAGLKYYEQNNPRKAKQEFDKANELTAALQK